jgi:hypothetical protein
MMHACSVQLTTLFRPLVRVAEGCTEGTWLLAPCLVSWLPTCWLCSPLCVTLIGRTTRGPGMGRKDVRLCGVTLLAT